MDASTERYLQSTFPFDSGKAVFFIPEGSRKTLPSEKNSEKTESKRHEASLTGEEAKEFYEEVLSLPEQSSRRSDGIRPGVVSHNIVSGYPKPRKKPGARISNIDIDSRETNPSQLFQYAQNNQLDLLQSALSSNCFDVNVQDNFHWTLLMVAAYAGHTRMVEYLLEVGAKWREHTDRGMNAADLARTRGYQDIADLIENNDPGDKSERICSSGVHFMPEQSTDGCSIDMDIESTVAKNRHSFYCNSCQMAVSGSSRARHGTSIVHLFGNNHQAPNVIPYGIPESNRGFQMLLRKGWDPGKGLGSQRQGHRFPVKTVLKQDRLGFGLEGGRARVTHFSAHDKEAIRSHKDRFKSKTRQSSRTKKDILQEKHKDRKWEMRIRTMMNHEDSIAHFLT